MPVYITIIIRIIEEKFIFITINQNFVNNGINNSLFKTMKMDVHNHINATNVMAGKN
jgi:hypothetical protein